MPQLCPDNYELAGLVKDNNSKWTADKVQNRMENAVQPTDAHIGLYIHQY